MYELDDNETTPELVLECLVAGRARLSDPSKWVKGMYQRGNQYCMVGAIGVSFNEATSQGAHAALERALPKRFNSVSRFNDHYKTDHAEMLSVFDAAIDKLKKELNVHEETS